MMEDLYFFLCVWAHVTSLLRLITHRSQRLSRCSDIVIFPDNEVCALKWELKFLERPDEITVRPPFLRTS